MAESFVEKQVRLVLETQCRECAELLKTKVPAGVGFTLFLADYGLDGNVAYVSTVDRTTSIRMVREWLDNRDPHAKVEENALLRRENSVLRDKAERALAIFDQLDELAKQPSAEALDAQAGPKLEALHKLLEEMAK